MERERKRNSKRDREREREMGWVGWYSTVCSVFHPEFPFEEESTRFTGRFT